MGKQAWEDSHYKARTKVNGLEIYLGHYPSREEAKAAVERYRKRKGLLPSAEARKENWQLNRSLGLHKPREAYRAK